MIAFNSLCQINSEALWTRKTTTREILAKATKCKENTAYGMRSDKLIPFEQYCRFYFPHFHPISGVGSFNLAISMVLYVQISASFNPILVDSRHLGKWIQIYNIRKSEWELNVKT